MYILLVRASFKSRLQYKMDFILSSVMAAVVQVVEFLMVALVLVKFGSIKGWSLYEVGYLYGVIMLSKSLYRSFASDVHHLEKYLVTGDLDQLLVRPVPVLLALMSQNFRIQIGELLQAGMVLTLCMKALVESGQIGWISIPLTLLVILSGAVILFSIGLATAAAGFWITRISELQTLTEDAARTAAQYPLALYPKWLQTLLLTVIPVGFVNYIPSLYILKNQGGAALIAGTLLLSALSLALSGKLWSYGMSRYQSTGS